MGAVKNYYHDEICAAEQPNEPSVCEGCGAAEASPYEAGHYGLCADCWEAINGQFGVGA